jgi:hypothetical protein
MGDTPRCRFQLSDTDDNHILIRIKAATRKCPVVFIRLPINCF